MTSGDYIPPASKLLGRRVLMQDHTKNVLCIEYTATPDFCNRHGTVQGGFLAAMLDSATALALLQQLPASKTAVTRRLTADFLRPSKPGTFRAEISAPAIVGANAVVTASLFDEGNAEVASATAELRIIDAR